MTTRDPDSVDAARWLGYAFAALLLVGVGAAIWGLVA